MKRAGFVLAVTAVAAMFGSRPLHADVRADEKTHVEFAGMMGRMMGMFGGKAAHEGLTSSVAVKGDRKATISDTTGQIIDLAEEKVYDLDLKKKAYRVTTFAELRRRMEESRQKAVENVNKEQAKQPQPEKPQNQKQMEIDFSIKNTGQQKTINGFDTHEVVMTVTMREKGKKLEESGGLVLTSDMWLGPKIAAMKEVADFDARYAKTLYGSMIAGVSPEQMGMALAMYPMMKDAIGKMNVEGGKVDGTAILTTTTTESVKSAEQMAQEAKQGQSDEDSKSTPSSISGAIGGFAKRAMKKKTEGEPQARSTIFTSTHEVLKVSTEVTPADVAVPAGFKESK
jgi:hypothetical protein